MKTNLLRAITKQLLIIGLFVFAQNSFAGDISFFGILKGQAFSQTTNAPPSSNTNSPFFFQCVVDSSGPDLITSASLQLPSSSSRILQPDGDEFAFREIFSSSSELNLTYGTGTYSLTIDSVNETNFVQVTMLSDAYPNTPQITNYTDAQAIDSSNDFTLAWEPFVSGTANDFIELTIRDSSDSTVFRSGDFGSPGALNGTNGSALLPANTFFPGETYRGELMFARPTTVDSTSIPGANGVVAFIKRVEFELKTSGTAPSIDLHLIGLTNGTFQFSFNTQPGKNYQIQFADTLPNWQNIGFTNATSSETIFADPFFTSTSARFYRVTAP